MKYTVEDIKARMTQIEGVKVPKLTLDQIAQLRYSAVVGDDWARDSFLRYALDCDLIEDKPEPKAEPRKNPRPRGSRTLKTAVSCAGVVTGRTCGLLMARTTRSRSAAAGTTSRTMTGAPRVSLRATGTTATAASARSGSSSATLTTCMASASGKLCTARRIAAAKTSVALRWRQIVARVNTCLVTTAIDPVHWVEATPGSSCPRSLHEMRPRRMATSPRLPRTRCVMAKSKRAGICGGCAVQVLSQLQ